MRVLEVLFEGERAVGVKVQYEDGSQREVRSRVVVDASGQSALIASRFKTRVVDPVLKKGALWTYFEGAYRDAGRDEGATLVLQTQDKKGWFWYIPLHNNMVSVGVVAAFEYLFDKSRGDHEAIFQQELDLSPETKRRVAMGRRVTDFYATKDYSYRSTKAAGPGWVLVGDAFGFLDPLYSSGVLLALKSGQLAADAINEETWPAMIFRGGAVGQVESGLRARHGPYAPSGVRVLRWLQLRPVCPQASPSEGPRDRRPDRRRLQGQRRRR